MPLLVNSVPNLAQGVSQQPDNLRFPGQCDEQINAWATVVEGLVKRPPTNYTKKIHSSSTDSDKLFTHFVKRSEQNKYCVAVSLGGVGVINLADGTNVSVAVTSIANSYLSLGGQASLGAVQNPLADLRALTVADYTFLVNKNRVIEKSTAADLKSQVPPDEALVVVKLGDYEKNYSVIIDDKVVPHTGGLHSNKTPSANYTYESGTSSTGLHADTTVIAEDLADCITSAVGPSNGITSLTISNGGSGWLAGGSSGWGGIPEDKNCRYKVQLEISQAGATSALFDLAVTKGVITGYSVVRSGSGFNTAGTFVQTYKVLFNCKGFGSWSNARYPSFIGSGQVITEGFSTRAAFSVEQKGSVIKITSSDGPFKIRVEDGLGDQALGVAYREVNSITDLPSKCFDGFTVKIKGDADIDQDDYYVRFSTKEKEDFGEGSWVETVGYYQDESPGALMESIDTALDDNTMPITLVPYFNDTTITDFILQTPNDTLVVKNGSNYYALQKDHRAATANEPGTGADWTDYWTEVPGISQGFLPWRLGTFYYGPNEKDIKRGWNTRQAGDDNTNPFPSFVGRTIRDIFFFKNRLGILTDSNVIFSEADEYYNFFRTTTQQLLDSAPIDVGLSHTKVALLENAVPFQEKLMLFSQSSQFVLRGADVLSPKTVAISPATEYDISDSVQPVALGNYIYFTFKRNDFEGVYEYFVDNNTETFHSEEITQQIPKYITANVQKIAGSQSENTIVISTTEDAKTLFVYKYFWSNKEKIQSAWMKFTFGRDVRGFDFIDSNLHLITADTDGLHLEKLTLEDGLTDTDLDYTLYLDSKIDDATSDINVSLYNPATKVTRVSNIPYNVSLGTTEIYTKLGNERAFTIVDSNTVDISGAIASYVSYDGSVYKCVTNHTSTASDTPDVSPYWSVSTDFTSATAWASGRFYNDDKYFVIGKSYNMLYRFSDQTLKQPTERGGRSASDYAYQTIRNGSIDYADTGHFTVEVTPQYRDTYSYAFNPDILGADLKLNEFVPQNGHFRFPVQAQPNEAKIEVKSDSALPVKLLGAEFESMFIPRSRRYGA
jgi:hypothetical protein